MKRLFLSMLLGLCALTLAAQTGPTKTLKFAQRDTCDLYLDIWEPAAGADILPDGSHKPTILYVFGGGFVTGRRDDPFCFPWFKVLNDNGYRVVSIDYRLGLKGVRMRFDIAHLIDAAKKTQHALDVGVEDVFSAVRYLSDHSAELGIDMSRIVISGSSAGAMISLSSEWEVCTPDERNSILPDGFRFAGVMSFAGAIVTDRGKPSYTSAPCPQLLFHGTRDGAVQYDKQAFGKRGMYGSSALAEILAKAGYPYHIYRYKGHSHDMAANMLETWPEQKRFLEQNVIAGLPLTIDALLDDPLMTVRQEITLGDIY